MLKPWGRDVDESHRQAAAPAREEATPARFARFSSIHLRYRGFSSVSFWQLNASPAWPFQDRCKHTRHVYLKDRSIRDAERVGGDCMLTSHGRPMAAPPVGCNVHLLIFLLFTHIEYFGLTDAITSTGKVFISRGNLPHHRPHIPSTVPPKSVQCKSRSVDR